MEKTDTELNELLEYAMRKKEILENIYDITFRRNFQGDESEIDEFIEYLDIRQPYYDQLEKLNSEHSDLLKDFVIEFDNKNRLYREVSQLLSIIKDIGAQIIELDRKNNEKMKRVYDKLASEIKKINAAKKARSSYNFFQAQSDDNRLGQ